MPMNAIVGILLGLARRPEHPSTERAWRQMDVIFHRYNNDSISMKAMSTWHAVEALCDQAMLRHPNRQHMGHTYAMRVENRQSLTTSEAGAVEPETEPMAPEGMDFSTPDAMQAALGQMFSSGIMLSPDEYPGADDGTSSYFNSANSGEFM